MGRIVESHLSGKFGVPFSRTYHLECSLDGVLNPDAYPYPVVRSSSEMHDMMRKIDANGIHLITRWHPRKAFYEGAYYFLNSAVLYTTVDGTDRMVDDLPDCISDYCSVKKLKFISENRENLTRLAEVLKIPLEQLVSA